MTSALVVRPVQITPSGMLALHAGNPERYPALFESAAGGTPNGRFDILFACPQDALTLRRDALVGPSRLTASNHGFLGALDDWWRELRAPIEHPSLPFTGGWLVYLGYELAGEIEPRLTLRSPASDVIATAMRIPAAIVIEHATAMAWIVVEAEYASLVDLIAADLATAHTDSPVRVDLLLRPMIEEAPERYLNIVRRALDYIARGDIYQANLSRSWRSDTRPGVRPVDVYRRLRSTNPGPFCALAAFKELAIVSSSPERLVRVHDGDVSTRPIAGTRPRGSTPALDRELLEELRAHPKERAEHVMLIDLERNDLGRVCTPGSVHVDEYMTIESYSHVHHIVSNVRGKLREDVGPGAVLRATFPGGTITGCPKVRCMEIVAELEDTARGAYTGSIGYLNRNGNMDFNILIRSFEMRDRQIELRAGAGIVADSLPERELEETRAKARGVLRALS